MIWLQDGLYGIFLGQPRLARFKISIKVPMCKKLTGLFDIGFSHTDFANGMTVSTGRFPQFGYP